MEVEERHNTISVRKEASLCFKFLVLNACSARSSCTFGLIILVPMQDSLLIVATRLIRNENFCLLSLCLLATTACSQNSKRGKNLGKGEITVIKRVALNQNGKLLFLIYIFHEANIKE